MSLPRMGIANVRNSLFHFLDGLKEAHPIRHSVKVLPLTDV